MTKHTARARTATALRDLDPATTTALTDDEQRRARATLARIMATPGQDHVPRASSEPRRRWVLVLVPASLVATAAIAVWMGLFSGSAFASWSPTPTALAPSAATSAAATCRAAMGIRDPQSRVALGDRRGGWTYVLLTGPRGEGACLMPDDLVGSLDEPGRRAGFFGSYDTDPPEPSFPARDAIVETESTSGSVALPGHAWLGTKQGWLSWTTGYAGSDVTAVTVHPPTGPAVEASLRGGRSRPGGRAPCPTVTPPARAADGPTP